MQLDLKSDTLWWRARRRQVESVEFVGFIEFVGFVEFIELMKTERLRETIEIIRD
jgi:hypothetical protein